MPALPDFWLKSLGFWTLLVPLHIVMLGIMIWARGMFAGVVIALTLFALSILGVLAVEIFLAWLTGPDVATEGTYRSRALRGWAPWPLGLALGYLPVGAWYTYRDYEYRKFLESLKNER